MMRARFFRNFGEHNHTITFLGEFKVVLKPGRSIGIVAGWIEVDDPWEVLEVPKDPETLQKPSETMVPINDLEVPVEELNPFGLITKEYLGHTPEDGECTDGSGLIMGID